MSPDPTELVGRLAELLATRLTRTGHLAAVVVQENRGNCPPNKACTPACQEANAVLTAAVEHLEGELGIERDAWMAGARRKAS